MSELFQKEWLEIEKQVEEINNKPKFKKWIDRNNQEIDEYMKSLEDSDHKE